MPIENQKRISHTMYEIFMGIQKFLLKYGILKYKQRQEYHIGWLAKDKTLEALRVHLHTQWGFGNHFISWIDEGQVLSWRKLSDAHKQHHIRVFEDGEIRGHLEPTPESGLWYHLTKNGKQKAQNDFLKFLGDFLSLTEVQQDLKVDHNIYNPNTESASS